MGFLDRDPGGAVMRRVEVFWVGMVSEGVSCRRLLFWSLCWNGGKN